MECRDVVDNLHEFVYEELDRDTSNEIKEHLHSCEACRAQYDQLKQLLVFDARTLVEAKERIEIPTDLEGKVRSTIGRQTIVRRVRLVLAACLASVLLYTAPVFAYYAVQMFPFEKYMDFMDKDMIKDFKEGRGQIIGKSHEMNGITMTIDGMIKKDDKRFILFTIKVPKTGEYNYGIPASGFNVITVQDQFGKIYNVGSASGTTERALTEGESQFIFEINEPISFWSTRLNVRVTSIELGITNQNEKVFFKKYKNVYGCWNVSFNINRTVDKR